MREAGDSVYWKAKGGPKATENLRKKRLKISGISTPRPSRGQLAWLSREIAKGYSPKKDAKEESSSSKWLWNHGWIYMGIHGRGGGMGYGVWHEFEHPKYGTLAFEASAYWADKLVVAKEEKAYCYRNFYDWYLLPHNSDFFLDIKFSGQGFEELEEVLREIDLGYYAA